MEYSLLNRIENQQINYFLVKESSISSLMAHIGFNLDLYKIPSKEILKNRLEFFGLWRRSDDEITIWLKRVQRCIRHCEFPTIILEFLLFHRFVCGLDANELESIRSISKSWTLNQLLDHFLDDSIDTGHIEGNNISLDIVKSEPVCLTSQNDSFNAIHFCLF